MPLVVDVGHLPMWRYISGCLVAFDGPLRVYDALPITGQGSMAVHDLTQSKLRRRGCEVITINGVRDTYTDTRPPATRRKLRG